VYLKNFSAKGRVYPKNSSTKQGITLKLGEKSKVYPKNLGLKAWSLPVFLQGGFELPYHPEACPMWLFGGFPATPRMTNSKRKPYHCFLERESVYQERRWCEAERGPREATCLVRGRLFDDHPISVVQERHRWQSTRSHTIRMRFSSQEISLGSPSADKML
jgi:hypothetical protein